MKTILLVGFGGFIGSVARYGLQQLAQQWHRTFPAGTLLVNLLGCLAIGLIYGASARGGWLAADGKLFLAIGVCGGFTTFSSFSYENIKLLQEGHTLQALLYIGASVLAGLMLTGLGMWLTAK